jgi:hypothetical protein
MYKTVWKLGKRYDKLKFHVISPVCGAGSLARIGHEPPKLGVVGSNPTPPATIASHTLKTFFTRVICVVWCVLAILT